jgi:DNA-binding response OmpR family regulator
MGMKALIADDDRTATLLVRRTFERCGLDVTVVHDGAAAWRILSEPEPPALVALDWMMPSLDGLEICRRVRRDRPKANIYILLLTSRESRADVVSGLDAGADDYIVKPFDHEELRARVQVGMRVVDLQTSLAMNVAQLQDALSKVKQLSGLLPICSYCHKIRNDEDYWQQMEQYLSQHSDARFSHGICPDCFKKVEAEFNAD